MKGQIKKLITLLSLSSLGPVPVAAANGLFRMENAPMLAIALIAGPGAIITASLLHGSIKERALAALLSGVIATSIIILSAIVGPKLLGFVNFNLIKIFAGLSVGIIALMISGIKLPSNLPLVIIALGIIAGIIWR
jgi:hypothetical protein